MNIKSILNKLKIPIFKKSRVSVRQRVKNKLSLTREQLIIKFKLYKVIDLSISDLLLMHTKNNEFYSCDICVQYLAIEAYYGMNDYGFELYEKMQSARKSLKNGEVASTNFKKLIASYKNGNEGFPPILVNKNLGLLEGSHHVALALFHGNDTIKANIIPINREVICSIDWFLQNNFTAKEITHIFKKSQQLIHMVNKPFTFVIWSPAVQLEKKILEDLSYYGKITYTKRHAFKMNEYIEIVSSIYAIDEIEKWKIDKKLGHMAEYEPVCIEIGLKIQNPQYRLKPSTNLPIVVQGERAKNSIRIKYRKQITHYYFDIILHSGDNLYQAEYMRNILNPHHTI